MILEGRGEKRSMISKVSSVVVQVIWYYNLALLCNINDTFLSSINALSFLGSSKSDLLLKVSSTHVFKTYLNDTSYD